MYNIFRLRKEVNKVNNHDIAKNNYFGIEVKIKIITNNLIVLEYEVPKLYNK